MHKEKNPDQSKIVQYQSESASSAPPPSKGLIALTQILESVPELYEKITITGKHGSQFSTAQYCCWPITNYSFITQ